MVGKNDREFGSWFESCEDAHWLLCGSDEGPSERGDEAPEPTVEATRTEDASRMRWLRRRVVEREPVPGGDGVERLPFPRAELDLAVLVR